MNVTIRERRVAMGLTLTELAKRAGVSKSYLSEIEQGKKPINSTRLQQVARALRTAPSDLLARPPGSAPASSGFSECTVDAWVPAPPTGEGGGNAQPFDPRTLAPKARHPVAYTIRHGGAGAFGIAPASVIVVDLNAAAQNRDLVLARRADPETGEAITILARLLGNHLLGPRFLSDPADCLRIDSRTISLVGPVVATLHAPALLGG